MPDRSEQRPRSIRQIWDHRPVFLGGKARQKTISPSHYSPFARYRAEHGFESDPLDSLIPSITYRPGGVYEMSDNELKHGRTVQNYLLHNPDNQVDVMDRLVEQISVIGYSRIEFGISQNERTVGYKTEGNIRNVKAFRSSTEQLQEVGIPSASSDDPIIGLRISQESKGVGEISEFNLYFRRHLVYLLDPRGGTYKRVSLLHFEPGIR